MLSAFGLKDIKNRPELENSIEKARHWGGVGEGEDHRKLKHYVADNPSVIGLRGFEKVETEFCFASNDKIDVPFSSEDTWAGVEVKARSSSREDIIRGIFQAVKYAAVGEAYLKSIFDKARIEIILVTSSRLTPDLRELKNLMGVTVIDGILVPEQDVSVRDTVVLEPGQR